MATKATHHVVKDGEALALKGGILKTASSQASNMVS
ncbi:hypothetical protein CCACVL1_30446 [Corchorus capsularis]|uniref:Uncharacterized protein n=1 Tax=Corchorus capsularis TaxID=210143 RepID=A0A1R3FX50_COCAP|nr:hypothetical protein CCACVL1_30446 [Corchorus capsularis]